MSADLLRQAATILRERAEAVDDQDDWQDFYEDPEFIVSPAAGRDDANWVALMSPGVGLALADFLDAQASALERHLRILTEVHGESVAVHYMPEPDVHLVHLARLIVGADQ